MAGIDGSENGNGNGAELPILTKEEILAAKDLRYELVEVPEWGGRVRIRTLTGRERGEFEVYVTTGQEPGQKKTLANLRERLCALAICDENGKRVFSDAELGKLGQKSVQALERVSSAAMRLSALSNAEMEALAGN